MEILGGDCTNERANGVREQNDGCPVEATPIRGKGMVAYGGNNRRHDAARFLQPESYSHSRPRISSRCRSPSRTAERSHTDTRDRKCAAILYSDRAVAGYRRANRCIFPGRAGREKRRSALQNRPTVV